MFLQTKSKLNSGSYFESYFVSECCLLIMMQNVRCYFPIISRFLIASVGMELFHAVPQTSDGHMYLPACGLGFQTFW